MSAASNPFEIARETLRRLASRRTPPTPDNYLKLYHEIAGTPVEQHEFPAAQLRSLNASIAAELPDQPKLNRQLEDAVKRGDWPQYQKTLVAHLQHLEACQKLGWAELIGQLLQQWQARHTGLTAARKKEALDHVLAAGSQPEVLHRRLQGLLTAWGSGQGEALAESGEAILPPAVPARSTRVDEHILPELRELFAFTLETAIATQLIETPSLASEARNLAQAIRIAQSVRQLQDFLTRLKRFAFRLELLAEEQGELRASLLQLLRLLVENASELVLDDQWLHGQIAIVRGIIDQPLSQRSLDDAERRLKEVIFKQSQLKAGLHEAREAIKHLLTGFVGHLASFAADTGEYQAMLGACAEKIGAARDITQLENVIGDVMRETRQIQHNARRAQDELQRAQQQVNAAQGRIHELERQLAESSELVQHDQLTGLLNRRGLDDLFAKEIARARRRASPLCVALLDIDDFKKLNDSLGHRGGDEALIHLAAVCRSVLRPEDSIARYGGEEFVILLPDTPATEASLALTRLQRELTKRFFLHDNEKILITFSAGLTLLREQDTAESALQRADAAMYQAKRSGKNRVICAEG